ncbi:MAG: hypothetical protein JO363_17665 [Solirubrobacterales bacterium]|nr:hypothetical protein [Solirubrobacterales bacterium]
MRRKLAIAAISITTALTALAAGLAGPAAADQSYQTFYVYGTGGAGVRAHTAPSTLDPVVQVIPEGASIGIICQDLGETVTDPGTGVSSNIWDKVGDGRVTMFISDLYATTPVAGDFSPGIPQCADVTSGVGGVPIGVM